MPNKVPNLPASVILDFIKNDFETSWNAVANIPNGTPQTGRGNFLFAKATMTLLEVACRICASDPSGKLLSDFSYSLYSQEPRYFIDLPKTKIFPQESVYKNAPEFNLPILPTNNGMPLMTAIFHIIRNGQAHQYQQILVSLQCGEDFGVSVTGAQHGLHLDLVRQRRVTDHLTEVPNSRPSIWLQVRTDQLYVDIDNAITQSSLRQGRLNHLSRKYDVSSQTLASTLFP